MFELPRVLLTARAGDFGVTRARIRTEVRHGNWQAFARGAVLTRPDPPTRVDWADLGIGMAGPSAALTGWDALRVVGLGDPQPPSERIIVLSRHSANRAIGPVRIRETNRPYRVTITPYDCSYPLAPIVDVARGVADAALEYHRADSVRALVAAAIQRNRCTVAQLVAEYEAGPRQRSALFREALERVMDGARSAAEAAAAKRLTVARVPTFELNVPLVRGGVVVAWADVLWRSLRAVLEIDSREFHFADEDQQSTRCRHNLLTRSNLALTHYAPSATRTPAWTAEVTEWLVARSREISVPLPSGTGPIRPGPDGPPPYVLA